jgi:hypothetical protein
LTSVSTFSLDVYQGFDSQQITVLQDAVLLSIPVSNFRNFSEYGISGISVHQLAILVQKVRGGSEGARRVVCKKGWERFVEKYYI